MPSGPEWIIVLAIVLLIFGGSQVPKLARNLGKAQKEFKDGLAESELQAKQSAEVDVAARRAQAGAVAPRAETDVTAPGADIHRDG